MNSMSPHSDICDTWRLAAAVGMETFWTAIPKLPVNVGMHPTGIAAVGAIEAVTA